MNLKIQLVPVLVKRLRLKYHTYSTNDFVSHIAASIDIVINKRLQWRTQDFSMGGFQ